MRHCVGLHVEVVIVARFVNANSPQNDRRMVPVTSNHAADVIDGDGLPWFVADVLPAGDFFEDEQAEFVAGIEEIWRLRVMGSSHNVALELPLQNISIATLTAGTHRLSHKREGLMPVQSAELDHLAI